MYSINCDIEKINLTIKPIICKKCGKLPQMKVDYFDWGYGKDFIIYCNCYLLENNTSFENAIERWNKINI